MNIITQFGNYFRKSPAIIIVFMVLILALAISISTTVEDYSTSYQGYMELPTRKINTWVIPMVAALPQVLQILMAYTFATDTKRGVAFWIMVGAHLVDVGLDVFYKSGGQLRYLVVSFLETEIVYTIGSEFLLTFSFAMILETFPDFVRQLNLTIDKSLRAIREIMPDHRQDNRPAFRPPQPQQQRQKQQQRQNPQKFQPGMPPKFPIPPMPNIERGEDERDW